MANWGLIGLPPFFFGAFQKLGLVNNYPKGGGPNLNFHLEGKPLFKEKKGFIKLVPFLK